MATTHKVVEKVTYHLTRRQKLQVDGVIKWYDADAEVDPKWFHHAHFRRLVELGFINERKTLEVVFEEPPAPPKPKAQAPSASPVAQPKKG